MTAPYLVTQVDGEAVDGPVTITVYTYNHQTWVFTSYSDPGLDYCVIPQGRTIHTYEPYDDGPVIGVDEVVWEAYTNLGRDS